VKGLSKTSKTFNPQMYFLKKLYFSKEKIMSTTSKQSMKSKLALIVTGLTLAVSAAAPALAQDSRDINLAERVHKTKTEFKLAQAYGRISIRECPYGLNNLYKGLGSSQL
jgi:hypothetical protein